jgi:hypothetical protein
LVAVEAVHMVDLLQLKMEETAALVVDKDSITQTVRLAV